jgi:hypothetical protein
MKTEDRVKLGGLLWAIAVLAGCQEAGELRTERHRVELEGAVAAEVELRMNAGELALRSDDQEYLMEGTFRFNRERLQPRIDFHLFNERGVLRIDQERSSGIMLGSIRNEWDIFLKREVPTDLSVKLGAGESDLDLRGIDLTALSVDMGVGEMTLNLLGPHKRSLDIRIEGGVGSGTIVLPDDVGVRVKVDGGLGSISARGLAKRDHVYTNDLYGTGDVSLEIDIDVGIGSLTLKVEPSRGIRIEASGFRGQGDLRFPRT